MSRSIDEIIREAMQRVTLQPGETRRVTFRLAEEALAFTRADGTHGVEPGNFHAWIAPDSQSGRQGEFRL